MTTPPRRARFIAGGPEDDDGTLPPPKTAKSYPCTADRCPGIGAIFLRSDQGLCHYHYAQNPQDWPRITQCLLDWACVVNEIRQGRRVLVADLTCTDVKAQAKALQEGVARLTEPAGSWMADLKPRQSAHLSDWLRQLENFMVLRVREALGGRA